MAYEFVDQPSNRYEFVEAPKQEQSWVDKQLKGLATAPINAYLGIKQKFGGLDSIEQNILAQNKEAERNATVSSILSNIATVVPSMMIPGAQSIAGAGAVSALQGFAQPVEGEQSLGNIAKGTLLNTGIGAALGSAGQYGANKVAGAFANRLANKTAEVAAAKSKNAMTDSALKAGREAGYVVPQSQVAPTFLSNRLESIGGKAAVKQEATMRNQEITNALTKKALGLADDTPISQSALDTLRKTAGKSYQEVADLSPQAAADLEALKVARNEATGWFNAYNRSARPDDLAKAKAARELSDQLEKSLETHAKAAGRDELIPSLVNARKQIAKTYTVERALNKATGDVAAPVIGRMFDKGKPLSDGLDVVGRFNQAFPQITRPSAVTQAPGVSFFEPVTMGAAGLLGQAATGSPMGLLAAGAPLLRGPARSMALSSMMQKPTQYSVGELTKLGAKVPPELLGLLARGNAGYLTPGLAGLLAAE